MTSTVRYLLQSNRTLSFLLIVVMTCVAWAYLLTMTTDMRDRMDMSEMGLGMGIFNLRDAAIHTAEITGHHHGHQDQHQGLDGTVTARAVGEPTESFGMPSVGKGWTAGDFMLVLIMWMMMMIAMMLPTAAPMILTYGDILYSQQSGENAFVPLSIFIGGYLCTWGAYSVVAVIGQYWMLQFDLISEMMVGANPAVNGVMLMLAGFYQWSWLKNACLTHCRSPLQFFLTSWQAGNVGALKMGIKHGAYCVGCCWALMVLMFFFGLMNLLWIVALSVIMLAEKVMPKGELFSRIVGLLLCAWGVAIIASVIV
ncbi:MAG: DUF2182 domain-containing protein [Desulforhopalus sp.]